MVHLVTFHDTDGTPSDISWYTWYTWRHFMVRMVHLVTFHGTCGTPSDISWFDLRWLKIHTQMSSKLLKIPNAACCRCCSSTMPQKGHPEGPYELNHSFASNLVLLFLVCLHILICNHVPRLIFCNLDYFLIC